MGLKTFLLDVTQKLSHVASAKTTAPDFNEAVTQTLKNEGVLSDDKFDPGGITKYGISLRFLKDCDIDVNHDNRINAEDILSLTQDSATEIYKDYFWQKFKIYLIHDQEIADKVFDLSVNMGGVQAIKLLQESINMNVVDRIAIDGILGKNTVNALSTIRTDILLHDYRNTAAAYYKHIVQLNPKLEIFIGGWLKRAAE